MRNADGAKGSANEDPPTHIYSHVEQLPNVSLDDVDVIVLPSGGSSAARNVNRHGGVGQS